MTGTQPLGVLTLLHERVATMVRRASARQLSFSNAPNETAFVSALPTRAWYAVIVDPTAMSDEVLLLVSDEARKHGRPLLLIASSTPLAARRVVAAAHHAPVRVLLADSEFTRQLLALEMGRLHLQSARESLLYAIGSSIAALCPSSICSGAVALFGGVPVPADVREFTRRVECSRRSVDRWAHRAGFGGAASLLRAVRLAWAWELAHATPSKPWEALAVACGYRSARAARAHLRCWLGIAPDALAGTPADPAFIDRLTQIAFGSPRLHRVVESH